MGRCDSLSKHLGRLIQRQAWAIKSTSTGVGLSQRKYFDSVKYNDPPTLNHNGHVSRLNNNRIG